MFQAGLTLECALKAVLAHGDKGFIGEKLRKKYGHRLKNLWRAAHKRGLDIDPSPPEWCAALHSGYSEPNSYFRFRENLSSLNVSMPAKMIASLE